MNDKFLAVIGLGGFVIMGFVFLGVMNKEPKPIQEHVEPPIERTGAHNTVWNNDKVKYFIDKRTMKCFAYAGGGNSFSFTYVPCDDMVRNAIIDDSKE